MYVTPMPSYLCPKRGYGPNTPEQKVNPAIQLPPTRNQATE